MFRIRVCRMQPLWRLTVCLGACWIASLLYGELIAFWIPVWNCSWPDLQQEFGSTKSREDRPIKVALIADPQLTDRTSYGMAPGSLVLKAVEFYSDLYMRRVFRSSVLGLQPDVVIFLGDHFDGGPYLSDDEWMQSLKRFEHIFDQTQRGLKRRSNIPMHYLAGNHDLGYHEVFAQKPQILERYKSKFGETDYSHKVGGVEFIVVNAQALDGARNDVSTNSSWSFVERIASKNTSDSAYEARVLLTHIPLYRPDNTPCGSARASRVINQRLRTSNSPPRRITYQDYLTNETSSKLLDLIKPVIVFSGHDHDQCKVIHPLPHGFYPEYTVGTFSWQQGNIYPSFMMLSVAPHASAMTGTFVSERLCFLPVQDFNYAWYGVLFVISILALLLWPSQGIDLAPVFRQLLEALKSPGSVKEKDEDAEWEMMWDAEGGMHLVKKSSPQTADQNVSQERRGKAVQRAAATKSRVTTAATESENSNVALNRSRAFSIWSRVHRMAGPFLVLLVVNFSMYVMLMSKDWT